MTSTPVTSTYAPSAFFRPRAPRAPRRLRRSSSTSSSSATSTSASGYLSTGDSTSEADSSDLSSSDEDEDEDDHGEGSSSSSELERSAGTMSGAWPRPSSSSSRPPTTAKPSATHSHQELKLSLSLLSARRSLSSCSFVSLASSLATLSSTLPSTVQGMQNLGTFIPILARLASDLETNLGAQEKDREWRKGLRKEEARALVGLRQRWSITGGEGAEGKGKGKQKEKEEDWVSLVRSLITAHPPPQFLAAPPSRADSALLTALEQLLLPSSLPRLSLAGLGLSSAQLEEWDIFKRAEEVVEWYLSFSPSVSASTEHKTARQVLNEVRSLDLSKNHLTSLPSFLPSLFPSLETLSLSSNSLRLLPPSLTAFHQLRRLRTRGNQLAKRGRTKLPRRRQRGGGAGGREKGSGDGQGEGDAGEEWQQQKEGPVRGNTREVTALVRSRMDSWTAGVAAAELGASHPALDDDGDGDPSTVASLMEIALQVARSALPSTTPATATELDTLPPHLLTALKESYTCCSCSTFITPLSTLLLPSSPPSSSSPPPTLHLHLHLPPLFDRLHFLSPGISLPSQILRPSPPPPRPPSPPPSPSQVRTLLTLEERVLLALYGRGMDLNTLVVGDERGYRHCLRCAVGHLGLLGEEQAAEGRSTGMGKECKCGVCEEERWVKGEASLRSGRERAEENDGKEQERKQGEGVMRWLRRRAGRRKVVVIGED